MLLVPPALTVSPAVTSNVPVLSVFVSASMVMVPSSAVTSPLRVMPSSAFKVIEPAVFASIVSVPSKELILPLATMLISAEPAVVVETAPVMVRPSILVVSLSLI